MARNIRAKSPTKRSNSREKYVIVELDAAGDVETYHTSRVFRTQQEAENHGSESGEECDYQLAVCKIVSVSNPPVPKQLTFKPV